MRLWFTVAVLALAFCVVAKADNPYEDEDEYNEYERSPSNYGRGYNNKYEKRINYKNDESEDVEVEKKKDYSNTDKSRDRGIDITRKGLNLKRLQNDKLETKSKSFKGSEKKKSSLRYKEKSNPRYGSDYKNDEYKTNKYDNYRKNKYDDDEYKPNKYDNYKVNNYDNYKKKEYKKDDYKPKEDKYERKEKSYPKMKSYKPKEEKDYKPDRYQKKTYKPSYSRPTYDSASDSKKLSATMKPEEKAYTAPKYDDVEGIVIDNDNNNINKNAEESRSSNSDSSANANEQRQEKKNEKLNYKENNGGSYRNKRN